MKKLITLCLFFLSTIIYFACKKDNHQSAPQLLISQAKHYFNSIQSTALQLTFDSSDPSRLHANKKPVWDQASIQTIDLSHQIVVVPLQYDRGFFIKSNLDKNKMFNLNKIAKLIIYRDTKSVFHAEVITIFPDSVYKPLSTFTGIVLAEDWNNNFLKEYHYDHIGMTRISKYSQTESTTLATAPTSLTICYYLEGYNYPINDPTHGYSYTESLGCTTYTFDNGNDGSLSGSQYAAIAGSGSVSLPAASTITEFKGNNPILAATTYFRCFQINSSSTYSATLYVDQPVNNSRSSYSSSGSAGTGLSIGHAFLALTQNQGGVITRRAVGLYPSGPVTPFTPSSKGSINDDEGHPFDVSLTISLTPDQFSAILNACANGNNAIYNLNSNNCVTWAISTLAAGGINIKTTPGTWPFGGGDDPGDLGQDLRNLALSSNMTRSTSFGYAPSNLNTCN